MSSVLYAYGSGPTDGITYYEIIRLKHMYGVSVAAMLVRLGQVGVLTPAAVRRTFRTFAPSWRRSEPEPLDAVERQITGPADG